MERGTHTELLSLSGTYAEMWALQQQSLLDNANEEEHDSHDSHDSHDNSKRETNV